MVGYRMVAVVIPFCLVGLPQGHAQGTTGVISGMVSDPTGAAVAAATVVALHTQTGVRYQATTNDVGLYLFPLLPPGVFELMAESAGFKRARQAGATLGLNQRLRVDLVLELGDTSETIEVTAASPLLKTDQASIGGSFGPNSFENLPIGRNPLAMMRSIPGVQGSRGAMWTGNIGGSREAMSDYRIDGTPAATTTQNAITTQPIVEMLEEVIVETSNYSAEFGRGASQVNLTTRSGGNQFHGAFFHYFRNDKLNANSFMNNALGTPRQPLRYNLFGATINGPIRLPRLYDGRQKTFFSFGFEATRERGYGQRIATVPLEAWRQGNFSGAPAIFNPATTRPGPNGGFIRDPFPGNIIPTSAIDPVAMRMLTEAYPLPNRTGVANNYVRAGAVPTDAHTINGRLDHHFSEKHRSTFRYLYLHSTATALLRFPGPAGAGSNNEREREFGPRHTASGNHIWVISPILIADFRFGSQYTYIEGSGPGTFQNWPEKLGIRNVPGDKFPVVAIAGQDGFGGSNLARVTHARNYNYSGSLTAQLGKHTMKWGGEFRDLDYDLARGSDISFRFDTLATADPATARNGFGMASYLLGLPTNTSLALIAPQGFQYRWSYWSGFLQDDIRLSPSLTMNLGIRWELNTPRTEAGNFQSSLNLRTLQFDFAGSNGFPETLYDPNYRNFQPRIGLAWTHRGWVVRAGYGLFYLPPNTTGDGGFSQGPWQRAFTWFTQDNGVTFPLRLRDAAPAVSLGGAFAPGLNTNSQFIGRRYPDGYMQQWNLNTQRMLRFGFMVETGYAGSRGVHLQSNRELNQVPGALLGPGNAQTRRPFPTLGGIQEAFAPIGISSYHSLQSRIERRLAGGFSMQGNYTMSKCMDDGSGFAGFRAFGVTAVQDNYNLRAEKSVCGFDITHNTSTNAVWQLPFGTGRKYLNNRGAGAWIAGGWNLSGFFTILSGRPLVMTTANNLTASLGGGSRPDRLNDLPLESRDRLRWFDQAGFAAPAPFRFGNTSRTEPRLREPGNISLDFLLAREFVLTEKVRAHLRAEWFNAMNHFNPGTPNTIIGHPAVGQINSGNAGRTIQLSLKLNY